MNQQENSNPPSQSFQFRDILQNYISLLGLALAIVAFVNIVILFLIDTTSSAPSPYIGIFAYMLVPGIMVFGLALIPLGMWRQRVARRKGVDLPKFPVLDFNSPAQRSRIAFFLTFIVIFVVLSAVGSYRAYEFTDSTRFCGQLCHTVMHPEFVAHQGSPHARVSCVECHVGAGAGWYVRSKLSGTRQLFKTALNTFPRPIETPVANLRPAQETCEQCHWPRKFWGAQMKVISHYGYDEKNTPRELSMLVKTGGGDANGGQGIHWHMNIANTLTYASDAKRQNIAYIQVKDRAGKITEYWAKDADRSKIPQMQQKRMDCVDCHNRPTHIYMPPDKSVDNALRTNLIDPSLPFAKQQGVQILTAEYKNTDEAMKAIAEKIPAYYRTTYPAIYSTKEKQVQQMVDSLQSIFKHSIFPEMKVDWRTHYDNVGHFYSLGCFRCHDGNHVSKEGKVISKDCTVCHTLLSQREGVTQLSGNAGGATFKHPVDLDLSSVNCSDCHTGAAQ